MKDEWIFKQSKFLTQIYDPLSPGVEHSELGEGELRREEEWFYYTHTSSSSHRIHKQWGQNFTHNYWSKVESES